MLGLSSEASYRFERGADVEMARYACDRAAALIQHVAGGTIYRELIDVYPRPRKPVTVMLRRTRIAAFLGAAVDDTTVERIFDRLAFKVSHAHQGWAIEVPSHRHDIVREEDLLEEVARHYQAAHYDPDGLFVTTRIWLSSLGYNTTLVKPQDAPRSYADLLDPKWTGKMVKAHPAYSGTIMTATFQIARELGWGFFEKLAKQRIMQVQSSTDPPKKLALGERMVMADGNDYNLIQLKEQGQAVEVVYPVEGTPTITGPTGVFKAAPNPNAARLFHNWLHSLEAQQLLVDFAAQHSPHALVKERPGRRKLSELKLFKDDPVGVEKMSEEIKTRYANLFGV